MIKFLFLLLMGATAINAKAQIIINPQIPPDGLVLKSNLWNILVINPAAGSLSVKLTCNLSDLKTGKPVMTGSSRIVNLMPGNNILTTEKVNPVQYSFSDPAYSGFVVNELLPPGNFMACFAAIHLKSGAVLAEECVAIEVTTGLPQLELPANEDNIDDKKPGFSWIPPMPAQSYGNLLYKLELLEWLPEQTLEDAVKQNPRIIQEHKIRPVEYKFPANDSLQQGKRYAWYITAFNGTNEIGKTTVWSFTVNTPQQAPYAVPQKDEAGNTIVFFKTVQLVYENEAGDSVLNAGITDITAAQQKNIPLPAGNYPLKTGTNYIQLHPTDIQQLQDKHIYLLQITNARNEKWKIQFEYRTGKK